MGCVGNDRDIAADGREPAAVSAARPAATRLEAVQRAVGNAGIGRLLAAPGGERALRQLTASPTLARWSWPWSKDPELLPTEPVEPERTYERCRPGCSSPRLRRARRHAFEDA